MGQNMNGLAAVSQLRKKADIVASSSNAMGAQAVTPWLDTFHKRRQPTPRDLLAELKNTAYSCVWINSNTSAMFPPAVYLKTTPGLPVPKSVPKSDLFDIAPMLRKSLQWHPTWRMKTKAGKDQFALPTHPIHDLFMRANRWHSGFNFWALLGQYIEVFGCAYLWIKYDEWTGIPMELRILPTQDVDPKWENWTAPDPWESLTPSRYQVRLQAQHRYAQFDLSPAEVIEVRMEDLANPFKGGRSPHQASFESTTLQSEYIAHRLALWQNHARPDCIVSPAPGEYLGDEELRRLKLQWVQEYARGGVGKPHFAQTPMRVDVLGFMENQIMLLGEAGATKEDILNGFGVPVSFYTRETNMANLAASTELYMRNTIRPKIYRRDQTLTERLCSIYDPTGSIFLSSEDPVPEDLEAKRLQEEMDLKYGLRSINQILADRGQPPVEWGETPWLPAYWAPVDMNMIWEVRKLLAYSRDDSADELTSARTRQRPEDTNDEDRQMSEYSGRPHVAVHGQSNSKPSKNGKGEVKKKALAYDDRQPLVVNVQVPEIKIPDINVPEIKIPDIVMPAHPPVSIRVDAPVVELNPTFEMNPTFDVPPMKQPVVNFTAPEPAKPRKRKAKWKDDEGKEHTIELVTE